jgi:hypothetical protein
MNAPETPPGIFIQITSHWRVWGKASPPDRKQQSKAGLVATPGKPQRPEPACLNPLSRLLKSALAVVHSASAWGEIIRESFVNSRLQDSFHLNLVGSRHERSQLILSQKFAHTNANCWLKEPLKGTITPGDLIFVSFLVASALLINVTHLYLSPIPMLARSRFAWRVGITGQLTKIRDFSFFWRGLVSKITEAMRCYIMGICQIKF